MSWTIDALYEHLTTVTNLILTRLVEMQAQWDRAVDLARDQATAERERLAAEMGHRLAGMNEFRDAMRDQASRFVTRKELWGYLFGAVSLISLIVILTIKFGGG